MGTLLDDALQDVCNILSVDLIVVGQFLFQLYKSYFQCIFAGLRIDKRILAIRSQPKSFTELIIPDGRTVFRKLVAELGHLIVIVFRLRLLGGLLLRGVALLAQLLEFAPTLSRFAIHLAKAGLKTFEFLFEGVDGFVFFLVLVLRLILRFGFLLLGLRFGFRFGFRIQILFQIQILVLLAVARLRAGRLAHYSKPPGHRWLLPASLK